LQISLPTGAKVVVKRNAASGTRSQFVNVDITPGLVDYEQTSGLCGNFNGDSTDDGKLEAIEGYPQFMRLKEESAKEHRYMIIVRLEFKPFLYTKM